MKHKFWANCAAWSGFFWIAFIIGFYIFFDYAFECHHSKAETLCFECRLYLILPHICFLLMTSASLLMFMLCKKKEMEIDINIYSRLKDIELMSRIEILELERKKKEIDEILNRLQKNSQTTRDKISELISDAVKTNSTQKMKE